MKAQEAPGLDSPLHALLQLSLLADLRELFLVVLAHLALLGPAPGVVLNAIHLLLPGLHQLVIALAELLFLKGGGTSYNQLLQNTNCVPFCAMMCCASAGTESNLESWPERSSMFSQLLGGAGCKADH